MYKINKEIAILHPFKHNLYCYYPNREIIRSGFVGIKDVVKILPSSKHLKLSVKNTVGDCVYKILTDKEIMYGPITYIAGKKVEIIQNINNLANLGQELCLSIAGFPHKMPNPFF